MHLKYISMIHFYLLKIARLLLKVITKWLFNFLSYCLWYRLFLCHNTNTVFVFYPDIQYYSKGCFWNIAKATQLSLKSHLFKPAIYFNRHQTAFSLFCSPKMCLISRPHFHHQRVHRQLQMANYTETCSLSRQSFFLPKS